MWEEHTGFILLIKEQTKQETIRSGWKTKLNSPSVSIGFLLGLLFGPEDGGDMFFRNVGLSSNYTALQSSDKQSPP
jgi:hypothetical protein